MELCCNLGNCIRSPWRPLADHISRPIFVVGSPRSGTTVIGACLGSHPRIMSGEESSFIRQLGQMYQSYFLGKNQRSFAPLQKYVTENRLLELIGAFADGIFSSFLGENWKAVRYLDHTPWYCHHLDLLARLYPDAQFIHVIRDGRDVALSLEVSWKRGFKWAGDTIESRARIWSDAIEAAGKTGAKLDPTQFIEIRYEQFCQDPIKTLTMLCVFLAEPMVDAVLQPLHINHAAPSRTSRTLAEVSGPTTVHITPQKIETGWPPHWSLQERSSFFLASRELLSRLGYC
jgi:hypothetical protein